MNIDREKINEIGKQIENLIKDFHGSIRFNYRNGSFINVNIEHTIHSPNRRREKEKC